MPPPRRSGFATDCALELEPGKPLPVFPMLMADTAPRSPTQLSRPLIGRVTLRSVPRVTLVHLLGDPNTGEFRRIHIRTERVESLGKTVADFEREAVHNVARRVASWKVMDVGTAKIAVCDDDFLACERLLDPSFMCRAAELLGQSNRPLLAGVPRRGMLLVTAFVAPPSMQLAFAQTIARMSSEPGPETVSPWPFLVSDGTVTAVMEIAAG